MARQLDSFSLQLAGPSVGTQANVTAALNAVYSFIQNPGPSGPPPDIATAVTELSNALLVILGAQGAGSTFNAAVAAMNVWSGNHGNTSLTGALVDLATQLKVNVGSVTELASVATAVHAKVGAIPDTGDSAAALAAFVPHITVS
jgi:hypothetical protein